MAANELAKFKNFLRSKNAVFGASIYWRKYTNLLVYHLPKTHY